jgi:MFS family permease
MMAFLKRYRGLPRNVVALSAVSLLNDTSSEIIYPLLPAFLALTLGATPFAIGLIEGIAESISALLKLVSGYLSDRFRSRKLPVFIGYFLAAVSRPVLAVAATWTQVLAVRVTDRVGKGIRGAPRDAILASSVEPERRGLAFGFNRAADHLGAVFGPLIATGLLLLLAHDPQHPSAEDYKAVFALASIPVVFGILTIIFFVKEDTSQAIVEKAPPLKLSLKEFDGNFKRFLLILFVFTLSNSTDAFLLLRAEQAGVPVALLPMLWMVLHFSKVAFSLIGGDLSDRIGRKVLIVSGWVVYAAVYAGFGFITEQWQAWALFMVYGAYFGLTEGAEKALVADLVPEEKRGTAYGFYNLAFSIGVLPASILFGVMWTYFGATVAFLFSAGTSLAAAGALTRVDGRR